MIDNATSKFPGRFNFIKNSKLLLNVSIVLTLVGLVFTLFKGFNFGIDFTGGNEIQVQFQQHFPPISEIRKFLNKNGYDNVLVQTFGEDKEILFRTKEVNLKKIEQLSKKIVSKWKGAEIRRVDSVGPQIGEELKRKGVLAIFYSLLLILVYLALRFEYTYAPSAIFCLFHDSILTMAIFSLLGREVNVQTLAAVLAIIGYSLNDTIVTFDRIRENKNIYSKKESFAQICNRSLNDVLSRTLLTSITTLLAVSCMWIFTSGVIKDFAFTLGIGVIIGTYSSMFVATPLTIIFDEFSQMREKKS